MNSSMRKYHVFVSKWRVGFQYSAKRASWDFDDFLKTNNINSHNLKKSFGSSIIELGEYSWERIIPRVVTKEIHLSLKTFYIYTLFKKCNSQHWWITGNLVLCFTLSVFLTKLRIHTAEFKKFMISHFKAPFTQYQIAIGAP